jgi:hypothetical protein
MPSLAVGSTYKRQTPTARYQGTVVALGGGFLIGVEALVTTSRATGAEVDEVGPISTRPVALPTSSVTALS